MSNTAKADKDFAIADSESSVCLLSSFPGSTMSASGIVADNEASAEDASTKHTESKDNLDSSAVRHLFSELSTQQTE